MTTVRKHLKQIPEGNAIIAYMEVNGYNRWLREHCPDVSSAIYSHVPPQIEHDLPISLLDIAYRLERQEDLVYVKSCSTKPIELETWLRNRFNYKRVRKELRPIAHNIYRNNIPDFNVPLKAPSGQTIASGYTRIVIGDYGAYVEFSKDQLLMPLQMKRGQEYRMNNPQYKCKYVWYTDFKQEVKIYYQLRTVDYADYKVGMYYISPFDLQLKENYL